MSAPIHSIASQQKIREKMRGLAGVLRLPFRLQNWRGPAGQLPGMGTGSSLDFQDHRPYLPGDDPRAINWQAYARTGVYTMKLYRDEVSPRLDLIIDTSGSMFFSPEKATRVLELIYFCVESALSHGASVRALLVGSHSLRPLESTELNAFDFGQFAQPDAERGAPKSSSSHRAKSLPVLIAQAGLRHGSLRVWISDLLFETAPGAVLPHLLAGRGRCMIFAPYVREESEPDWQGNVEFIDCESAEDRHQSVTPVLLENYRLAYQRHIQEWKNHSRKLGMPLARVCADEPVREELLREGLPQGAIEIWT